ELGSQQEVDERRATTHRYSVRAEPVSGEQLLPDTQRPALEPHPATVTHERHGMIERVAECEARACGRVSDAQQQQPVLAERAAYAIQHPFLPGVIEVVQHVEDHHGIGAAVVYVADVA